MLPITRPRTTASLTSTSARIRPCSPISRRSQFRISPSNSPSIFSVPATISVPRKLEPTPTTVFGGCTSSGSLLRVRNRIMTSPAAWDIPVWRKGRSQHTPGFEQPLQVLLRVELELHPAALASGSNRNLGRELLLQPCLPLAETLEP